MYNYNINTMQLRYDTGTIPLRKIIIVSVIMLFGSIPLKAQVDTTRTSGNLLEKLSAESNNSVPLLPNKILFTQRIFWGEKGLMRNFDNFKLTPGKRQNELKVRRIMLFTHQAMGTVTLAGMIAQGIVGSQLYNGNTNLKDVHETLATVVNITYFTTASLALFAPPKMLDTRKGYSSIKVHKILAIIHFSSMIATNILAGLLESNPELRPYHRATAYTAFGAFALSMVVLKF
jgi:hypothetical protein